MIPESKERIILRSDMITWPIKEKKDTISSVLFSRVNCDSDTTTALIIDSQTTHQETDAIIWLLAEARNKLIKIHGYQFQLYVALVPLKLGQIGFT